MEFVIKKLKKLVSHVSWIVDHAIIMNVKKIAAKMEDVMMEFVSAIVDGVVHPVNYQVCLFYIILLLSENYKSKLKYYCSKHSSGDCR